MTYIATVDVQQPGRGILPPVVERALKIRQETRLLVLQAGQAVILVREDPEIRRIVERNERILKEKGVTVSDVLRLLRKQRQTACRHGHARHSA